MVRSKKKNPLRIDNKNSTIRKIRILSDLYDYQLKKIPNLYIYFKKYYKMIFSITVQNSLKQNKFNLRKPR